MLIKKHLFQCASMNAWALNRFTQIQQKKFSVQFGSHKSIRLYNTADHFSFIRPSPLQICKPSTMKPIARSEELHILPMRRWFSTNDSDEQLLFDVEDEDEFDDLLSQSSKPILVNFHADWCGPCQNLKPRLDAKVLGQQGKILLAKVNVEENSDIAGRFDIQAVPTIICFKDGDMVHRFEGDVDDAYLDQVMANLMLKEEGLSKNRAGRIVPDESEKDNIF